jgi:hypothetical protein
VYWFLLAFLRAYLAAAEGDAAFQLALLGSDGPRREGVAQQKSEFRAIVTRIVSHAVAAGAVRADLTFSDFLLIISGAMSVMYFKPTGDSDWRRHLDLVLDGIRAKPR